jgi:hypothetical protein
VIFVVFFAVHLYHHG